MTDFTNVSDLKQFEIPGLTFVDGPLAKIVIETSACQAELYLQGAHLTRWQPVSNEPVLFLSDRSLYASGKAIRGGVPIIFPWFGARTATAGSDRTDGPAHGFARTAIWQFVSAKMRGADIEIILNLEADEHSRALGFDNFRLEYKVLLGAEATLSLSVHNDSNETLYFTEALHTYLAVGDVEKILLSGLVNTMYFDKVDGFKKKTQSEEKLQISGEVDRPYINTDATVTVHDPVLRRNLMISKSNSHTTVVWNPGADLTAKMADMNSEAWKTMVCVETANAINAIALGSGESHVMVAKITVQQAK